MDWRNRIGWTGRAAPEILSTSDTDLWAIWVKFDGRWTGVFEHHRKPTYPCLSYYERFGFSRSYRSRARLLYYARCYVQQKGNGDGETG
jgi:hypothetical protein